MHTIHDKEFGDIIVRRSSRTRNTTIKLSTKRQLIISTTPRMTLLALKAVVAGSRNQIRQLVKSLPSGTRIYVHGQRIGRSHQLSIVESGLVTKPRATVTRQFLVTTIPHGENPESHDVQHAIREMVAKIYRKEARDYLPGRLASLARTDQFHFERVRFSHAAGRWGSCSSTGTISLNIALMQLPDALIDYVLIHELCHTVHMNHSPAFWELVEKHDIAFRSHRKQLKQFSPTI